MSEKPLLYSYVRFSTPEQAKGHSLKRQLSYAKSVAEERGLQLDESLSMRDLGLSAYHGANISKGAFGLFLKAVEEGNVPTGSILLIESLDRVSRKGITDCASIMTQIINAGITVITALDNKEYNKELLDKSPFELFGMLTIFIRAHEESDTKSRRVRDVLKQQCDDWNAGKRGIRVSSGKAPNWVQWDKVNKKFVFKEREKQIMLRKIELFKKGFGGLKIAEKLNEEFGPKTTHHTGANVYKEVKRRTLIGELNVRVGEIDYVLSDYYPQLITHDEFDLLITDSRKRGAIKYSQKFVGICSGINVFKCGNCGKSVGTHVVQRNKKLEDIPESHKRYGCVEARRNNNCNNKKTIQVIAIETAIVKYCKDKINLTRILTENNEQSNIKAKERKLLDRKRTIETKIDNLISAIMGLESKTKTIVTKIAQLEGELEEVDKLIDENKNKLLKVTNVYSDEIIAKWQNLTNNLNELTSEERLTIRLLVKDTFESISLHPIVPPALEGIAKTIAMHRDELLQSNSSNYVDLSLKFHNGLIRTIRIDKYTGDLIKGFDLELIGD
ncbi:recombinase family protein [Thalassotalea agariperforans]